MGKWLQDVGVRRVCAAAGLLVVLYVAVAVSVPRHPGGALPQSADHPPTPPLIARLATAIIAAVLPDPARAAPTTAASHAPSGPGSAHYFKASELDRRPFPLKRIIVPVPESSDIQSGAVIIRLRISERGRVEDAKIVVGSGAAAFEAAALREFSRAAFRPGYRKNLPVRTEMLIEVKLHPPQDAAKPQLRGSAPK